MTSISAFSTELPSCQARSRPSVARALLKVGTSAALIAPFGEQVAQQVGDAERDQERIHRVAGAEPVGQHLFADQPEHAAGHGGGADDAGRAGEVAGGRSGRRRDWAASRSRSAPDLTQPFEA